jgi:hypothetical protein
VCKAPASASKKPNKSSKHVTFYQQANANPWHGWVDTDSIRPWRDGCPAAKATCRPTAFRAAVAAAVKAHLGKEDLKTVSSAFVRVTVCARARVCAFVCVRARWWACALACTYVYVCVCVPPHMA